MFIWSSGGPHVRWSRTIYANLVEGIMRNIHVKLSGSLAALLFSGAEPFMQFRKRASLGKLM